MVHCAIMLLGGWCICFKLRAWCHGNSLFIWKTAATLWEGKGPVCVYMCLTFSINPQQNKYPFLPGSMKLYGRVKLLFYFWHQIFRMEHMNHLENNVKMKILISWIWGGD